MARLPETGEEEKVLGNEEIFENEETSDCEETVKNEERPDGEETGISGSEEWPDDEEIIEYEVLSGYTEDSGKGGKRPKRRGRFFTGFLAGSLTTVCLALVFFLGWNAAGRRFLEKGSAGDDAELLVNKETLYKLNEAQSLIEQHYLDEVDSDTLSAYLFKGIAAGLEDDYADYYTEEELQSLLDSTRGAYYGVGAVLTEDTRTREIRVLEVYDNNPASEAGLEPGDILVSLEDTALTDMGLSEAVALIKSRDGPFTLTVFRPETEEELQLEMECREVELEFVQAEMMADGIGYLKLTEFSEKAVDQFADALETLKSQGMEKLIVDLRNNPGGLLDSVCDILDMILPEGLIVYTEDKDGGREEHYADGERSFSGEVAVLVNGNSASASEIFAGAVQDYELGPIIGSQTYGKGVVQQTFLLSDGSALKMTTEKYFTPKGQDINGNGITPDIAVEDPEDPVPEGFSDETEGFVSDGASDETEDFVSDGISDETEGFVSDGISDEPEDSVSAGGSDEAEDPVLARALEELG